MAKHRYPCPKCQHEILVSLTQSGQELICPACNHSFDAPKLQVLREYPADTVQSKAPVLEQRLSRGLFAAGLILLLLFGSAAAGLQLYSNRLIGDFDLANLDKTIADNADKLPPAEIVRYWFQIEEKSELEEWHEHPAIRNRTQGRIIRKFAYGVWAVAALGLSMTLISPWFKKS